MGYRSDLYAYVHGSDLINFMSVLKETKLEECFERIDNIEGIDEQGYARFHAECVKWYNGLDEIDAVNDVFLKSNVSILLRIGEEPLDHVYYSGNTDELAEVFDITNHVSVDF